MQASPDPLGHSDTGLPLVTKRSQLNSYFKNTFPLQRENHSYFNATSSPSLGQQYFHLEKGREFKNSHLNRSVPSPIPLRRLHTCPLIQSDEKTAPILRSTFARDMRVNLGELLSIFSFSEPKLKRRTRCCVVLYIDT